MSDLDKLTVIKAKMKDLSAIHCSYYNFGRVDTNQLNTPRDHLEKDDVKWLIRKLDEYLKPLEIER